jgi:hypothetical protein
MKREEDLNHRIDQLLSGLAHDFADLALPGGESLRWHIGRAVLHRAVHFVAERGGAEYCAVATYLAEMIGHAHQLLHGRDRQGEAHKDMLH